MLMSNDSFQRTNKKERDIIRSTENGHFRKATKDTDIPHTVGTGKDQEAKDRKRKGLKNPHSQSWAEAKKKAEENRKSAGPNAMMSTEPNLTKTGGDASA